jgi:DNA-binding NarL/FixJ family response regulator
VFLIADDDEGFRRFMRRAVESVAGWRVIGEAVDGEEAVRKALQLMPRAVLIDMDLPRIDGLEATRRIKATAPGIIVIMFASLDGTAYREAAARSGADDFFPKTAPISQILATIRRWCPPKAA